MSKKHGGLIVDLGNVIIAHWMTSITEATFHTVDYDAIPEVPGVMESIKYFNDLFEGNVTVAYNATGIANVKITKWLTTHRFSERTGVPESRVVRSLTGRNKTRFLEQSSDSFTGASVVVDDRLEVLTYFIGRVERLYLFHPQEEEVARFGGTPDGVTVVERWDEILAHYQKEPVR